MFHPKTPRAPETRFIRPTTAGPYCPLNGQLCSPRCAWYMPDGCAVKVLPIWASRQAGELYAIAEIMQGRQMDPTQPPEKNSEAQGGADG